MNMQQERQPTAEENFRTLFQRVANLSDRVSELEHPVTMKRSEANRILTALEHTRDLIAHEVETRRPRDGDPETVAEQALDAVHDAIRRFTDVTR